MKKTFYAIFLFCSAGLLSAAPPADNSPDKPFVITFFGSPTCEQCLEIKTQLLQPLEAGHAPKLHVNYRNIEDTNDVKVCLSMEKGYKVQQTASQELFFPDTVLVGYDAIMNSGKTLIESYLANPEKSVYHHAYGNTAIDTVDPAQLLRQQKELDSICSSFAIDSCNGLTITLGCKKEKPCGLAVHLAAFARWLVFKGKTHDECINDLTDRVNCLTSHQTFVIDEKNMPIAGDRKAPTTIVIYMSATCPLCKYLVCSLFDEVTAGSLEGKAKLIAKPLTQTVGDRALLAADSRFWDFIKALNYRKGRPDERMVARIADSIGFKGPGIKRSSEDAAIAKTLAQIHDEGIKNGVTVTPTIFINGKRYRSYKDPRWVVDAVLCIQDK